MSIRIEQNKAEMINEKTGRNLLQLNKNE